MKLLALNLVNAAENAFRLHALLMVSRTLLGNLGILTLVRQLLAAVLGDR